MHARGTPLMVDVLVDAQRLFGGSLEGIVGEVFYLPVAGFAALRRALIGGGGALAAAHEIVALLAPAAGTVALEAVGDARTLVRLVRVHRNACAGRSLANAAAVTAVVRAPAALKAKTGARSVVPVVAVRAGDAVARVVPILAYEPADTRRAHLLEFNRLLELRRLLSPQRLCAGGEERHEDGGAPP